MFKSYQIRVPNRNYLKISYISSAVCVIGLAYSMFLYDIAVDMALKRSMPITPKSINRGTFLKVPFPLEFHAHVFHIENPEDVQNGSKPHLKDIGPYVFHEYILKHDTVDDEENDTLEYTLKKTWIFKPELSNGLTGSENVTILHPVISSLALTVNVNRKGFLRMISEVIQTMFKPKTPFWSGRAMDLLFDGIPIDCTSKQFNVKSICAIFKSGENAAIQPISDKKSWYKFSLLGAYNDSFNGRFKVYRGKKYIKDIGRVIEVDGQSKMTTWNSDEANEFKGTDGYFTPPFMNKHEPLFSFERMLCATFNLVFVKKKYVHGLPFWKFSNNLKSFASDEGYCRKGVSCPIEGTLDLFTCMGAPIVATLPHFLDTHPLLLENIASGVHPKKEDHEIYVYVDLKMGVPLVGMKRMQFNFEVVPIQQVEVMQNLRSMIFPFAWIEERAVLPTSLATGVQIFAFFRQLNSLIKYLCLSLAPIIAIISLTVHFLIKYGEIQMISDSVSPLDVIESKTGSKSSRHVTDIGISSPKKIGKF